MSIPAGNKKNLKTLVAACAADRVALMEVKDSKTGEVVDAICAVNDKGGELEFVPLAVMLRENPYERLQPPDPNDDDEFCPLALN